MSLVALEKFHRQLVDVGKCRLSDILSAEREKKFSFYFPKPDGLDYSAVIEKINGCMGHLINVVTGPYLVLRTQFETVRTETAGALSPEGVKKTVADSKIWKRRGDSVMPEYAYSRTSEDEYNTYENRLVKALIDRLILFLGRPMGDMRSGIKSLYEAHSNVSSLNKFDLIKMLDPDHFKESDERCFIDYTKLFYLRARLYRLQGSAFYKIMMRFPPFDSAAAKATNLFVHNPDYNACFLLWNYLNETDVRMGDLQSEGERAAYCAYLFLASASALTKLGYTLTKDVPVRYGGKRFRSEGAEFENDLFSLRLTADEQRLSVLLYCKETGERQQTNVGIRFEPEDPRLPKCQYFVCFFPENYLDDTICVLPDNRNSLCDLLTLFRCIAMTVEVEPGIYDRVCLVCGSHDVEVGKGRVRCFDCGAVYTLLNKNLVWINNFTVRDKR